MDAVLATLCLLTGCGTCSVFSWDLTFMPTSRCLEEAEASKVVRAICENDHWVGVFIARVKKGFLHSRNFTNNVLACLSLGPGLDCIVSEGLDSFHVLGASH
jgi:hypothetical protein